MNRGWIAATFIAAFSGVAGLFIAAVCTAAGNTGSDKLAIIGGIVFIWAICVAFTIGLVYEEK